MEATGLDLSPVQTGQALARWGHLPSARFVQADAVDYLTSTPERWDAIYSIWGAAWFADPARLFPLVRARLVPGGRFVFSHAPAVPGSYGVQGMYGNGLTGRQIWIYRWAYEPDTWAGILRDHGFSDVHAWVEPAPQQGHVGTLLIVTATN